MPAQVLTARSLVALAAAASTATVAAQRILSASPAFGATTLRWSAVTPAPRAYIVDATPLSFTDTFAGGSIDPDWVWNSPACPIVPSPRCNWGVSAPGNLSITVTGNADSSASNVRGEMPLFVRPEVLDGHADWSATVFVDTASGNGGTNWDNTGAGLTVWDPITQLPTWVFQVVSWNGNTFIECKVFGAGRMGGFPAVVGGRAWLRLEYRWATQLFGMSARTTGTTFSTPQWISLADVGLANNAYLSRMQVALHARSWRGSGSYTFMFSSFTLTTFGDAGAFPVSLAVPGTATSANVTAPYFISYQYRVRAWYGNGTLTAPSAPTMGLTILPPVPDLPVNFSNTSPLDLRLQYWLDFSRERGGASASFVNDLSGKRNWAQQRTTIRQPRLVSNYMGPRTAWVASLDSFMDLTPGPNTADTNLDGRQAVFFVIARMNMPAGMSGGLVNKGGFDDNQIGFGIWAYGSPTNINFKVRAKAGAPNAENTAGILRNVPVQTASPIVLTFMQVYDVGCHWRRLLGYEDDRSSFNLPWWFATSPSPWISQTWGTDTDGLWRAGLEIAPCTYSAACQPTCSYAWQNPSNSAAVRIGADPAVFGSGAMFQGEIYEVLFASERIPDAQLTALRDHYMAKYYVVCAARLHPTANASATAPCARGYGSQTCTAACNDAGAALVSGALTRTCTSGRWQGGAPPICSRTCATLPRPSNIASCTYQRMRDTFAMGSGLLAGTELHRYEIYPANPDAFAFGTLFRLGDGGGGLQADTTSRWGLPRAAAPAMIYASLPNAWVTATSISSALTFTATMRIASGAAGLVWRVSDGGAAGFSYYRLLLSASTDGTARSQVVQRVTGPAATPTIVAVGASALATIPLLSTVTVTVGMSGGVISTAINGTALHTGVTDAIPLGHGSAGIIVDGIAEVTELTVTTPCDAGDTVGNAVDGMGVVHTCSPGYAGSGAATRTCSAAGAWSGSAFTCAAIPPTFSDTMVTVPENSPVDTMVGAPLNATSLLAVTYAITAGNVGGAFKVDACSGQLRVAAAILDFETRPSYSLTVAATIAEDAAAVTSRTVTVTLINVNEPPTLVTGSVSLYESALVGTFLTPALTCVDPENDPCSFSLVLGNDAGTFYVQPQGAFAANLVLNASGVLDFEAAPVLALGIRVFDPAAPAVQSQATLLVNVLDMNEAPVITRGLVLAITESAARVAGPAAPALTSLPVTAADQDAGPNGAVTYSLVEAVGGALTDGTAPRLGGVGPFTINATTGIIELRSAVTVVDPQQEVVVDDTWVTRAAWKLLVRATDGGGLSDTRNVTVVVVVDGSSSSSAFITSVQQPLDADTVGGESVTLLGDQLDALANSTATITMTYGPYTATGCRAFAADAFQGGQPARIICLTVPGVGAGHVMTLRANGVRVRMASRFAFAYGVPSVTAVSNLPPAVIANTTGLPVPGQLRTQGSETIHIWGARLGNNVSAVSVRYGPAAAPTRFTATVTAAAHSYVTVSTGAGLGSGLVVTIVVGGQTFTSSAALGLAYAAPAVTSVTATLGGAVTALPTVGGAGITIRGSNFGPYLLDGVPVTAAVSLGYLPDPAQAAFWAASCVKSSDAVLTHTTIFCAAPPGIGTGLFVGAAVDGRWSDAITALPLVGYAPPAIVRVSGAGAADADTAGGQLLVVEGSGFGPTTDNGVVTVTDTSDVRFPRGAGGVTYGPYTAAGCRVVTQSRVECLTAPGTGAGYVFTITIAGQAFTLTGAGVSRQSYGRPSLLSLAGAGATNASTEGGQTVVLTGRNYGTAFNASSPAWVVRYLLATPTGRNLSYVATACVVTVPHVELQCMTAPGVGRALDWSITIDGLTSTTPQSDYGAPIVTAVGGFDGSAVTNAVAGSWVWVWGLNFGTPGNGSAGSSVDAITYGPAAAEGTYTATAWEVISHRLLRFMVAPGVGSALGIIVTVAGQASAASSGAAATFAYRRPTVASVMPRFFDTDFVAGSVEVTVTGRSFGLDDSGAAAVVQLGNTGDLTQVTLPISGGRILADGQQQVTFRLPPGIGPNRAVRIGVYRRSIGADPRFTVYSDAIADTPGMSAILPDVPGAIINNVTGVGAFFTFHAPRLEAITVSLPRTPEELSYAATLGCTQGPVACNYRMLQLQGLNFGPAPSEVSDSVLRQVELADYDTGTFFQLSPIPALHWSQRMVTVATMSTRLRVRLRITTVSATGSPQVQTTQLLRYQALSPAISALTGSPAIVPTSGGTTAALLVVGAANLDRASPIRITVGGADCPIYDASGTTQLTPAAAAATLVALDGTATLRCLIPPGQGSFVPVQVLSLENGEWRPSALSTDPSLAISYAAPVIDSFGVQAVAGAAPSDRASFTMAAYTNPVAATVTVPTDGSQWLRLTGSNFGTCPTLRFGGGIITVYTCSDASRGIVATPGVIRSHTELIVPVPAGEGAALVTTVSVADQATDTQPVTVAYAPPVITAITAANATSGMPTSGGTRVLIAGRNFGQPLSTGSVTVSPYISSAFAVNYSDPWPPVVRVGVGAAIAAVLPRQPFAPPYDGSDGFRVCIDVQRLSHTLLSCTLPEGSGALLAVEVQVGASGTPVRLLGAFSYDAPAVTGIACSSCWTGGYAPDASNRVSGLRQVFAAVASNASAASGGGIVRPASNGLVAGDAAAATPAIITLTGRNFGVAAASGSFINCLFLLWPYSTAGGADATYCDGLETFHGEGETAITSHSHTSITFTVALAGVGGGGEMLGTRDVVLAINGNLNTRATAAAGTFVPRLVFAPPHITAVEPAVGTTDGGTRVTIRGTGFGTPPWDLAQSPLPFSLGAISIPQARAIPTAHLRVDMHRGCVTDARSLDGSVPGALASCRYTLVSRSSSELVLLSAPGIGVNRTLNVSVVEMQALGGLTTQSSWPAARWSYLPPTIDVTLPQVLLVRGGAGSGTFDFTLTGANFGRLEDADRDGWTAEERRMDLTVAGTACRVATRGTRGSLNVVTCTVDAMAAGPKNLTLVIAGQTAWMNASDVNALIVACEYGYVAAIGETCIACPVGAECRGYDQRTSVTLLPPGAAGRFVDPRPLAGFFNLNETARSACPAGLDIPGRSWCIAPCEPAAACLGDNLCATGYESRAPMFRCASCARGYFRRAGECVRCPDSPYALVIGFTLVVVGMGVAAYFLNRKGVNIAFVSIAVDFFQVLGMFLNAKIPWPPSVKELLYILSAFNLNIEIVAPECLVPDVAYSQKVSAILLLPVAVATLLACVWVIYALFKVWMRGRGWKDAWAHTSVCISTFSTLFWLLYLYESRTALDMLNCAPTTPPTYGANGQLQTYLAGVFEECWIPGGTHLTLFPVAVTALTVYSFAYPLGVTYLLWRRREIAMEDQLLRAKGAGNDRLSNPAAYDFRKRWSRLYYFFKPDYVAWIGAIFLRKFGIAVTSIVFNRTGAFQMAGCLLVMFLAYAAQVRYVPYMSPSDMDGVLRSHEASALQSATHARLKVALMAIATRGRKRTHKNLLTFDGKVDRSAVLGVLASWLLNYNTAEALLLFAAVIVCLMAIMYLATVTGGVTFYPEARNAITAVIMLTMLLALIYIAIAVGSEIYTLCTARERTAQLRRASLASRASGVDKDSARRSTIAGSGVGTGPGADGGSEVLVGPVENQLNPMFLSGGTAGTGTGASASDEAVAEAILSHRGGPPPAELWAVFQSSYAGVVQQMDQLRGMLAAARKREALGSPRDGEGGDGAEADMAGMPAARTPTASKSRTEFRPSQAADTTAAAVAGHDVRSTAGHLAAASAGVAGALSVRGANPLRAARGVPSRGAASATSARSLGAGGGK